MLAASMIGASMPETPVNEDGDLGSREDNVGMAPKAWKWLPMHEVAQTEPVQFPTKGKLRSGVSSGQTAHSLANRLG